MYVFDFVYEVHILMLSGHDINKEGVFIGGHVWISIVQKVKLCESYSCNITPNNVVCGLIIR